MEQTAISIAFFASGWDLVPNKKITQREKIVTEAVMTTDGIEVWKWSIFGRWR